MKRSILLFLMLPAFFLSAQTEGGEDRWELPYHYKKVGINVMPLLVQLIPFNRSNPIVTGPYSVEFNRYMGRRSFHTSLGMFMVPNVDFEDTDDFHFNFRIGTEKTRSISGRWSHFTGWDAYFSAGDLNIVGQKQNFDSAAIGIGPRWGIMFAIQKQVTISVETALLLGLDVNESLPNFTFIPPVGVNLNFIIPKKE